MATLGLTELESSLAALQLTAPLPVIESANVLNNPLDICRSLLAQILAEIVETSAEAAYKSIQWPNNIYNGDLAVVLPKLRAGSKAADVAIDLAKKFPTNNPLFPLPFTEGVHFRILLNVNVLARFLLPFIFERGSAYGNDATLGLQNPSSPDDGRKKLLVEFSSPNITHELHGRHLRSTILGEFVSKFHENMGWDVTRINYLGDWGKNIALLKVGWDRFGDEEAYTASPIEHLLDVYAKIDELFQPEMALSRQARDEAARNNQDEGQAQAEIENQGIYAERNTVFKKLEDGDEIIRAFWERVRNVNIDTDKDFYAQLGIHFDEYSGESQISTDIMAEIEGLLKEKGICEESSGALVVHMKNYGLKAGTAMIRDRNGASTYLLRDLAAMIERSRKYNFDKMIIVAANDHNSLHFTHLHHILVALDMKNLADKIQHLKFNESSKMADALGKGYKPQAIISYIEEAIRASLKTDEEKGTIFGDASKSAKPLAITSLLAQELSTRTSSAHAFDVPAMTAFKLGTGPDLQYWYAKLGSVLGENSGVAIDQLTDEEFDSLLEDAPSNLLRVLAQYPEVMHATYSSLEPQAVMTFLTSVTEQFADCLDDDEDEDEEGEENGEAEEAEPDSAAKTFTAGQLALFKATNIVLENGMKLLGITPYTKDDANRADTPVTD